MLTVWRRRRLRVRYRRQVPAAVQLLAGALRAGLSFPQAMAVLAADGPMELRSLVQRAIAAHETGAPWPEALAGWGEEIGGEDIEQLVFAIRVLHEVGGNLADVCDRLAAAARERARVAARWQAMTLQGQLSGVVIAALPLVIGAVMWRLTPGLVEPLVTTWIGRAALGLGLILELLGLWWMRRIVTPAW